jgi:SHS2 domain-containing protein
MLEATAAVVAVLGSLTRQERVARRIRLSETSGFDGVQPAAGRWAHFEHRADIGVEGTGATPAAAFEQAALALTAIICDPSEVRLAKAIYIRCEEADLELLFVDWLNALVYRMATERMLFSGFQVAIDGPRLAARVWGEPVDPARHRPAVEVKGATYTALAVRQQTDGSWIARCVVDV